MLKFLELMERLQALRSLRQISRDTGIPLSTIRYAMKAKHGPRLDTVTRLVAYEQQLKECAADVA